MANSERGDPVFDAENECFPRPDVSFTSRDICTDNQHQTIGSATNVPGAAPNFGREVGEVYHDPTPLFGPGGDKLESSSSVASVGYILIFACALMTMANIACLSVSFRGSEGIVGTPFPNGDHALKCQDRPSDDTCFEMHDFEGKTIYRSEGRKRVLELYKCDSVARETERFKCMGEYVFSHNSTLIWFHRLYLDKDTNTYSLVSGPEAQDSRQIYPRVRHMLDEPYNWVISYDAIPSNDFPQSSLYVRGSVVVADAHTPSP
jgi:hypothetical protein